MAPFTLSLWDRYWMRWPQLIFSVTFWQKMNEQYLKNFLVTAIQQPSKTTNCCMLIRLSILENTPTIFKSFGFNIRGIYQQVYIFFIVTQWIKEGLGVRFCRFLYYLISTYNMTILLFNRGLFSMSYFPISRRLSKLIRFTVSLTYMAICITNVL